MTQATLTDTDESPRPEHQIASDTYTPECLPEFDVYCAVIDVTTDTLESEVPA